VGVLNRRAAESGGKAPCRHMETTAQPTLPRGPGIGRLRKEPVGHVEQPGARLQLIVTPPATTLAGADRMRSRPARQQIPAQPLGTLGDQGGDRRPERVPIQPAQCPCAHPAHPAVQRGAVRMARAQVLHRPPQSHVRQLGIAVDRADRLDHRQRVTLERKDLGGKHPIAMCAEPASAQRHGCGAVLDPVLDPPQSPPLHPLRGVPQPLRLPAVWAGDVVAHAFPLDGCRLQRIIRDGNGNWDSTLSDSPRGTGAPTPVPHFLQKATTLPLQPSLRKALVHNRALMSLSISFSLGGNPEPVRRVLPMSLRGH
jgi:hypothetical protein